MRTKPQRITPAQAAKWLTKNTCNRPLSQTTVNRYAAAMAAGEWKINGDSIRFDERGNLIDGQHRLHACVKSGKAFESYIVTDLPVEAFDTIDQGRPRTMADVLARRGEKHYAVLAAAIRIIWLLRYVGYSSPDKLRPAVMDEVLKDHPGLREATEAARALNPPRGSKPLLPGSYVAAFWYLFNGLKPIKNKEFWARVAEGTDLRKDMPEFHLRRRLLDNVANQAKLSNSVIFALIIKAWNASSANQVMKSLRWSDTEEFPNIAGMEPLVRVVKEAPAPAPKLAKTA